MTDGLKSLSDRVITLQGITSTFLAAAVVADGNLSSPAQQFASSTIADRRLPPDPVYQVPASPWVGSGSTDDGISRVLSCYLNIVNPNFKYLGIDLFLRDMRSGGTNSLYCSSLLVHAVLAAGSLYSEHKEAFTQPGDLLTRGEQYHEEALRLWKLEDGRASITNLQALGILAAESAWRGHDRLGWSLIQSVFDMHQKLITKAAPPAVNDSAARTYIRALACTTNWVMWNQMWWITAVAVRPESFMISMDDAPSLEQIWVDEDSEWQSSPQKSAVMPVHHNNLLAAEIMTATKILWRLMHDIVPHMNDRPAQLGMIQIYLCDYWSEVLLNEAGLHFFRHDRDAIRQKPLDHAISAGNLMRDFRQRYGLKQIPAFMFQLAGIATGSLLRGLQEMQQQSSRSKTACQNEAEIIEAFEECCRLLLAFSMQMMLPRGITRMLHATVLKMGIRLPASVRSMLQLFGGDVWIAGDLEAFSSIYPNLSRGPPIMPNDAERLESAIQDLKI
ncbi:hypothetical protein Slin15195_G000590 [Septoria linicola]|uniref:Xylanolytic transcriptional activator regulatory domain-containing protein n=1 Tax=Septoria linicola TaxID=215465 RepID=A0A9Q9EDF7_9PEZI|nr:hypothetical protein Slin15195_G000590 [Septoria linicola]